MTCLPYFGVGKVPESGIQIPLVRVFFLSQPQLLISYIWCEISDTFAAFSESKDKCLLVGTQWWVGGHQWCDQWWPGVGSLQEMGFAGMGGLGSVRKMSGHFLSTHRNTEEKKHKQKWQNVRYLVGCLKSPKHQTHKQVLPNYITPDMFGLVVLLFGFN